MSKLQAIVGQDLNNPIIKIDDFATAIARLVTKLRHEFGNSHL
jgi:hypothetical protein